MYKVPLNNQRMQALKPALPFAKGTIKTEILRGISTLYKTNQGNLLVVLRPEGSELVVVAVAGSNLLSSQQEIISFATISGFKTLRFHARNPKHLEKGLRGLNYSMVEVRRHLLSGVEYVFRIRL